MHENAGVAETGVSANIT